MNIEIINKIDEITDIIKNDKDLIKMKKLEKLIENNHDLMNKINNLKGINEFDKEYVKLKNEILSNKEYKEYKNLEKDLFFVIQLINKKLNSLRESGGCL